MKHISIQCKLCKKIYDFDITEEQYEKYIHKEDLIQNIFPEIKPELRELFISKICPDCWNKLFPSDEE